MDRSVDNHYPTQFWDKIAALKPPAAKDCILFCWSTRPQLMTTGRMIEDQWGFEYKTCSVWDKRLRGTGHIVIDNAEVLLIASRGHPVWPAKGTQDLALIQTISDEPWENIFPRVFEERRRAPSEKPDFYAEAIHRLWPNTSTIEMYARKTRPWPNWEAWGAEVPADNTKDAAE